MWRAWQLRLVCVTLVALPIGLSQPAGWRPTLPGSVAAAGARPAAVRLVCQPGLTVSPDCIAKISGSGSPPLKEPEGIAVNAAGDVFVADTGNSLIREITAGSRTLTTVAGGGSDDTANGGSPTDAALENPAGVAVDAHGNLFIADTDDHRVLEVSADLRSITTVAGDAGGGNTATAEPSGPALGATMNPKAIAVDAGDTIYITDGNEVRSIGAATPRTINTVAGNNTDDTSGYCCDGTDNAGVPATKAKLYGPSGLAFDAAGNLYIADYNNLRVRKLDAATHVITTVAGSGDGGYGGDCGPATAALVYEPNGVAMDRKGNLYFTGDNVVRMVDTTGRIVTVAGVIGKEDTIGCDPHGSATGVGFGDLWGIAIDGAGNLYLTDNQTGAVQEVGAPAAALAPRAAPTPQPTQTPAAHPEDVVLSVYPAPQTISTGESIPVVVYAVPGSKVALDLQLVTSAAQVLYEATTAVAVGSDGSASASIPVSFDPHGSEHVTAVIRATTARGMDVRRFEVTITTGP